MAHRVQWQTLPLRLPGEELSGSRYDLISAKPLALGGTDRWRLTDSVWRDFAAAIATLATAPAAITTLPDAAVGDAGEGGLTRLCDEGQNEEPIWRQ